jgi:hypothetical protein
MQSIIRQLLRNEHLVKRYGRSQRTLDRWKARGVLPPPDMVINGIAYWYPETIEQNERERLNAKPSDEAADNARFRSHKSKTQIEPRAE